MRHEKGNELMVWELQNGGYSDAEYKLLKIEGYDHVTRLLEKAQAISRTFNLMGNKEELEIEILESTDKLVRTSKAKDGKLSELKDGGGQVERATYILQITVIS